MNPFDGGEGFVQLDAYDSFVVQIVEMIINPLFIDKSSGFEVPSKQYKVYVHGDHDDFLRLINYYKIDQENQTESFGQNS